MTTINCLNGTSITVTECYILPMDDEYHWGVSGTLYHGDADLISDYLANPSIEPLYVHGVLHTITVSHNAGRFTLEVESCGEVSRAKFTQKHARDIVFALGGVEPYASNPYRG